MPELDDLRGRWQRSLIRMPDGTRDDSSHVCWLQGVRSYADLRQPADAAGWLTGPGLAHLSMSDCERLAQQEGFAGRLGTRGAYFEWERLIDYQPATPAADAGSLQWEDDILVEVGRDVDYREHWHLDRTARQPCAAAWLREARTEVDALLLRVGHWFMFVRDRTVALPPHRRLATCIASAPSLEVAQRMVDCEISLGQIGDGGFRIASSTLPYRRGCLLQQQRSRDRWSMADRAADGEEERREWCLVAQEGDLDCL